MTPVLYIIYNRPELTKQSFQTIRDAQPSQLYVAADGPIDSNDAIKCQAARAEIVVDWDCDVRYEYSDVNLGLAENTIRAITSVFHHVTSTIILEDDCIISPSFFPYCDELLNRYRDRSQVGLITAKSTDTPFDSYPYSYYFSRIPRTWGWATWRDRWSRYDRRLTDWPEIKASGLLKEIVTDDFLPFFTKIFDLMYIQTDRQFTWDYQWWYTMLINNMVAIAPTVNLVVNQGFGPDATNTTEHQDQAELGSLAFPLRHPPSLIDLHSRDILERFNEQ